ncbi:hypothetical protein KP803_18980 [Vibrio sp. ZSDE26]|uniref:Uncharacterized protein n=1 Tax=Vibrio amylolyticus TaxID=2847292 RepID=A0A9X2BJM2_9VIBR|nr:hypothetical protein [Vibrio amylolyticus]MCK6265355.1 hypothetical protein [Vibrio amylolyticus]
MKNGMVCIDGLKAQRGATALLVTALLLMGALAFALGSYRGVFYQIKVANNQIDARKAHWRAEGGLECGFSSIVLNNDTSIPIDLNTTCSDMDLVYLQASSADPERLIAKYGNREIGKTIVFTSDSGAGAIKSTSDLVVFGNAEFPPPDPGEKNSDGMYECVAVVVRSNIIIKGNISNQGVGSTISKPSEDFDNSSDCAPSHKTGIGGINGIWQDASNNYVSTGVKLDFQRDETLNPFTTKFDFERGDWEQVRDHPDFEFLSYTMLGNDVDCVAKFKADLVTGQPNKVWIDGSCEFDQSAIDEITAIQSTNSGTYLFLLVHNGVLGIRGSGSIEGIVFHFTENFAANPEHWDAFSTTLQADLNANFTDPIETVYGATTTLTPKHATYLQSGSFKFTGGMIFDTQGQMALFNNSMRLQYNSDITESFVFSAKPKWKEGSWSDH